MAQEEYPTLDGFAPSWADIETSHLIYDGPKVDTKDYKGISWSDELEIGELRGASGGRVRKRTRGSYSAEAEITFYKEGWRRMREALKETAIAKGFVDAAGNAQIGMVAWDTLIKHTTPSREGDSDIHEVLLEGLRVKGRGQDLTEGVDPDTVVVPVQVMRIVEDGAVLL